MATNTRFHRVCQKRAAWPSVWTENPHQRPGPGPRSGPTLCDSRYLRGQRLAVQRDGARLLHRLASVLQRQVPARCEGGTHILRCHVWSHVGVPCAARRGAEWRAPRPSSSSATPAATPRRRAPRARRWRSHSCWRTRAAPRGRNPPKTAAKRPARPYINATERRVTKFSSGTIWETLRARNRPGGPGPSRSRCSRRPCSVRGAAARPTRSRTAVTPCSVLVRSSGASLRGRQVAVHNGGTWPHRSPTALSAPIESDGWGRTTRPISRFQSSATPARTGNRGVCWR
jgi:hypothetical protein